jgi:hypothetical protein
VSHQTGFGNNETKPTRPSKPDNDVDARKRTQLSPRRMVSNREFTAFFGLRHPHDAARRFERSFWFT